MTGLFQVVEKGGEKIHKDVENACEDALGHIVNPIVECTDVDGIVRRIDVNNVVERIDPNELLNRVDINKQLELVHINALMKHVDIDDLVQRSNLAAIVAESSSGVFTGIMDSMRIQVVDVDLCLYRWFQCNRKIIPPAPGKVNTFTLYPNGNMEKAIAVQEHYCGIFSKGMALLIDWLLMLVLLAIIITAADAAYRRAYLLFVNSEQTAERLAEQDDLWVADNRHSLCAVSLLLVVCDNTGTNDWNECHGCACRKCQWHKRCFLCKSSDSDCRLVGCHFLLARHDLGGHYSS